MTTAHEIIALIRGIGHGEISDDEAADLIDQYAAVKASASAIEATRVAYDRCLDLIGQGKRENTRMIGHAAWKLLKALEAMPMNVGAAIAMEDDTRSDIVTELIEAGYAVEAGGTLRCTLLGKQFVRQESNLGKRDD